MASIIKIGKKWRATIAIRGSRKSKSFGTKAAAAAWALKEEAEFGQIVSNNQTFADLLNRYAKTVSPKKKGQHWEVKQLERFCRKPLASVRLSDLGPSHIAQWRDERLHEVSPGTVLREWNLLSHACNVAVREWQWLSTNPMSTVSRPAEPDPRDRRISDDEINRLILVSGYEYDTRPDTLSGRCAACFLFAIETAMRAGEICYLKWANVSEKTAFLSKTKNGQSRLVPLSKEAIRLIEQMKGADAGYVFGISTSQLESNFRRMKKKAAIDGLTFHDSRREAASRLAKKLDVMELAKVTGHTDLKILLKVYYAPSIEDMADKL